ncbi:MAG: HlyD family efflux transporter periplasmic adaptor subunit [Opitutales bacterium]|nr:HlyD family efflux transporter periplasmic adaptor subunit [Opitutales bacterium]MCH8539826.1 HlyD family efflux transporter periplasmic adaptor subunit [Opitutales bacterium]
MPEYPTIPTPLWIRWRQFRTQALPFLIFAGVVLAVAYLWNREIAPTHMVGEVYAPVSEAIAPEAGILTSLKKGLYEEVEAGEIIARIEPLPAEFGIPTQPIEVRAPTAGIITALSSQPGTFIQAGTVLATIRSNQPEYIVGYILQPAGNLPQAGDSIEVVTRGGQRQSALSTVRSIGPQFEPLGPAFQHPFSETEERALPILIDIPPGLSILPGERIDLRIIETR